MRRDGASKRAGGRACKRWVGGRAGDRRATRRLTLQSSPSGMYTVSAHAAVSAIQFAIVVAAGKAGFSVTL